MNNTVTCSDTVFATVITHGNTIFRTTLRGMTSFEETVKTISLAICGMAAGMVTVILRNGNQGWSMKRNLRITPSGNRPHNEAVQLTLF